MLRPVRTRTGRNAPSAPTTMTRLSVPVAINASFGTSGTDGPPSGRRRTSANMPGARRPSGLRKTMRARWVRLIGSICGSRASTSPANVCPGKASIVASTGVPARMPATPACGIDASSHSVAVPLMRNSGVPASTVWPSRTSTSLTTPSLGAVRVTPSWPLRPDTPSTRNRCCAALCSSRADAERASPSACASASALLHSGANRLASGCPRRTVSNGALTFRRVTMPSTRALTADSWRKSQVNVAGTRISDASVPMSTGAVRMPTFCCTPDAMRTPDADVTSAYLGTSCMSMNGDLPGLSKCWSGTIGSYQYSALR